jgi:hypothetical protein
VGSEPRDPNSGHLTKHILIPAGDLVNSRGFRTHGKVARPARRDRGRRTISVGSEPRLLTRSPAGIGARRTISPWVQNPTAIDKIPCGDRCAPYDFRGFGTHGY